MAVAHQCETAPRSSARRRITHHCARQRWLMALRLPEYEDRDVGLAALIEGSDEVGVEKDPQIIAIARTRHLNFAVRVVTDRRVAEIVRDFVTRRSLHKPRDRQRESI